MSIDYYIIVNGQVTPMKKILVTGSDGLIGTNLKPRLLNLGYEIIAYDLKADNNICDTKKLEPLVKQCEGVIHLAAVSRVVWGENDPDLCWRTNALASRGLIGLALKQSPKPWVLLASSREVYGEQSSLPVLDSTPVNPVNIYGRSKVEMEKAGLSARKLGLAVAIIRFANVYGSVTDHHDRVLPAFCKAAVLGEPLRVDGLGNTFDFTHIKDTTEGILKVVERLEGGVIDLPPMHLLPGIPTTLENAAKLAIQASNSTSIIQEAPSRNYDVSRFYGAPHNAKNLLDWDAKISPQEGIKMLVKEFENNLKEKSS